MREIKFRAWINEWRWNLYTPTGEDQQKEDASWMQYFKENKIEPCNDDYILMQYTGLKDKNGKEIYEGDIVEIPDDYDNFGFMALEKREVYFLDGCFRLKPLKKTKGRGHTIEDDMNMCKVIGNIYENPDLLNNK